MLVRYGVAHYERVSLNNFWNFTITWQDYKPRRPINVLCFVRTQPIHLVESAPICYDGKHSSLEIY